MITICPKIPKTLYNKHFKLHGNNALKCYSLHREYSQKVSSSSKPVSLGGYYAFGTLTLIGGATLCYAKYDDQFRKYLKGNVPFTDDLIKFIFQEELTYEQRYQNIQNTVSKYIPSFLSTQTPESTLTSASKSKIVQEFPEKSGSGKADSTPKNLEAKSTVVSMPIDPILEPYSKRSEDKETLKVAEEEVRKPEVKQISVAAKPKHIVNIEKEINEVSGTALKSYGLAVTSLRNFTRDVDTLVEQNFERVDSKVWHNLKLLSEQKNQAIENAEKNAKEAQETIQMYKKMFERKDLKLDDENLASTMQAINRAEKELREVQNSYNKEVLNAKITERFWDKVEYARKQYQEELGILCPSIKLEDTKLNLSEGEIDLFILHTQKKIQYLQKELAKLDTKREYELENAIQKAKESGNVDPLVEEELKILLDREKRQLMEVFQKKALEVQANAERDIKAQLKRQSEAHSDHLNDAIRSKENELKRSFDRQLNEEVLKAKLDYKAQLAAMVGRLKGVDNALKDLDEELQVRADADKNAHQSQALWSACQSLHQAVKNELNENPDSQPIPLAKHVDAISKAGDDDELVKAVVNSIPNTVLERGVYNESALRERFDKVEKLAKRLALVPDEGAKLPVYLLSFIQSLLLVNAASLITKEELNDEVVDFSQFSTSDILARARYWLDRGDFHLTLQYMNLLSGASRTVSEDWMQEVKILLETKQAANTLMAHAAANGLVYL
ncbi:MICOS complex subunit Mic60 isoform X2 [Chrysoperla carnea]|uniref:MICOS complex subunit Mic60 isoform X2 n=1 Tax=Chrysoperla carnea TaxID=189513 RepID=UPI001D061FF8|nr:MICOS complex subunit Mic60 isoform X2 [Chrysoperla carnea]